MFGHLLARLRGRLQLGPTNSYGDAKLDRQVVEDGVFAWMALADLVQAQGARLAFEFLPLGLEDYRELLDRLAAQLR